jgi:hypothetical protein
MKRIINRTVKMVLDSLGYEYAKCNEDTVHGRVFN